MTAVALNPWPEADPSILAPMAEHDDLRDIVRNLLERKADHESVRLSCTTVVGYSTDLWAQLNRDLELSAMLIPDQLGGAGFGLRELAVVLEEVGAALLPEPVLASAVLAAAVMARADDPADFVSERADLIAGRTVVTVAAGELEVAILNGLTLTGSLPRVLQGHAADLFVVDAGAAGFFLVDVRETGVRIELPEVLDLTRRQARATLRSVPARLLIGPERAAEVRRDLGTLTAIAVASEHVGIIDRVLSLTTQYVQQRHQFGRAIGSFQAIKHRLADVLVDLERARSAARYAAATFDENPEAALLPAHVAGAICTDAVIRATHEMVQLHGGIGFTWEHPAHFYVRRALGDEGLFGDARMHRAHVARLIGV